MGQRSTRITLTRMDARVAVTRRWARTTKRLDLIRAPRGRWRVATVAALLLAILAGCASGSQATTTPTATATPTVAGTPTPTLAPGLSPTPADQPTPLTGLLGPLPPLCGPTHCGPGDCTLTPAPNELTVPDFGGGFTGSTTFEGSSPVWELGLGFELHLNKYAGQQPYPAEKVMWVVGPNYPQWVELSGHELKTHAPMWFQMFPSNGGPGAGGPGALTERAILLPSTPNRGSAQNSLGTWNIWGIGVGAQTAGCYELDVTCPAGTWNTVIAIGR